MFDEIWISSTIIIIISIYFCIQKYAIFNSYKIFYLFSLFFFGIAPLVHYENQSSFFGGRQILKKEYLFLNIIIIVLLISFHFVYRYFINFDYTLSFKKLKTRNVSIGYLLLLALLFLVNKLLLYKELSFSNLFLRKSQTNLYGIETSISTVIYNFLFLFPAILCLHLFFLWEEKMTLKKYIVTILFFLASFPTSLSRTSFAVVYLPLIILLFPFVFRKNNFVYFFIIGFSYVFPFLDQFRRITSLRQTKFGINMSFFNTAHYDSYYNFALILNDIPIQWGRQILGVLLFFIPRSFWTDKPIGSGALLAEHLNMTFTNISANYFAEGYINFGFWGIGLFLFILAFFSCVIDKIGLKMYLDKSPIFLLYLQFIFLLFYLLRGDLMSSFALLIIIIFFNIIILKILYKF